MHKSTMNGIHKVFIHCDLYVFPSCGICDCKVWCSVILSYLFRLTSNCSDKSIRLGLEIVRTGRGHIAVLLRIFFLSGFYEVEGKAIWHDRCRLPFASEQSTNQKPF
jgi:hypothetical protein